MTFVPVFLVELDDALRREIQDWPERARDEFVVLAYGLGAADSTEVLRHIGGTADWVAHGNFHLTYVVDHPRKVIRVTAGTPCTHGIEPGARYSYACHQHPASPHYQGTGAYVPVPEVAEHRRRYVPGR